MSLLKFLITKQFLKHLGLALGIIILLLISTFVSLSIYTNHGDAHTVPDFKELTAEQYTALVKKQGFRYNIMDSVHAEGYLPGAVIDQTPAAGSKVKKNRTIHFTINAMSPEKVVVPDLKNYSLRNAKVLLEQYGLKAGKLIYIPSEYLNEVLGQHFEGKAIEPGTFLLKGSEIDLLIGKGLGSATSIPDLTGLKLQEARNYLLSVSLNIGATIYDASIITPEDSLRAFIWQQRPMATTGKSLPMGSSINVWLSTDSALIMPDTMVIDSIQLELNKLETNQPSEEF